MSAFIRALGIVAVLTLLCVGGILVSSGTSEDDFEKRFERTFGKSFEEMFENTWNQAFEKSWNETFGDDFDEALRTRFREAFSAGFREAFRQMFDETQREASEDFDKEVSVDMRKEEETFHDGDQMGWKDELTFDESAADLDRLELETVNGDIKITGSDTDTIHIVASRTVRSTDEERGEAYREEFRPIIRRRGSTLVVETHRPEENKSRPRYIKEAKMAYEVSVPSRFGVEAKTVNGSVKVKETQDEASLHTVNGSIELTASKGLSGSACVKTVNGTIRVRAPHLTGKSDMETVNGKIEVTANELFEGGLRAKTLNGSIHVRVPHDAAFHLSAKAAMSGSIKTDWGEPGKSRRRFGKSYEANVNGGGEHVDLETFNGSIRVERVD
jgi:hypothetical protein